MRTGTAARAEFGLFFRQIQARFSRLYAHILAQVNMTLPQYALLTVLMEDGLMPMSDAGKKLHITKPAVTYLADQLEKKKYLKRCACGDRRVTLLQLTADGHKNARRIQEQVLHFLFETMEHFKEGEKKVIRRFYALLSERVGRELAGKKGRRP